PPRTLTERTRGDRGGAAPVLGGGDPGQGATVPVLCPPPPAARLRRRGAVALSARNAGGTSRAGQRRSRRAFGRVRAGGASLRAAPRRGSAPQGRSARAPRPLRRGDGGRGRA